MRKIVMARIATIMKSEELVKEASSPPTCRSTRRWILNCSRGLLDSATPRPQSPLPLPVLIAVRVAVQRHRRLDDGVDPGDRPQQEKHDQHCRAGPQQPIEAPADDSADQEPHRQLDGEPEHPARRRLRYSAPAAVAALRRPHLIA